MERSYEIGGRHLEIFFGDITDLPVDAIVNSENSDLRMDVSCGPSVSAAIRRIEGEEFAQETARRGPLELGGAVAVPARKLRARFVIHAASVKKVGPDQHETSPEAIAKAVRSSLAVASSLGLKTVALPAFGVRAARLPREVASEVMIDGIVEHLSKPTSLEKVVLALLDPKSFVVFFERAILRARAATAPLVLDLERRGEDLLARFEGPGAVASVERGPSSARDLDHARERLDRLARSRDRSLAGRVSELRATGGFVWSFLLPESVRERLAQTPARTLVLRTDETLASVPWELAWDGEAFLSERFAVARALVAEGHVAKKTRRASKPRVLVIAAPTGDLDHASREGEALLAETFANGVAAELLGGERATRTRVLERLAGASALHFAGHERNLAWALADGELSPRDLARLDGARLRFVFANACAPVDARERLGLGRAFLLAGAESYVGTLWEVEDEAARSFAMTLWGELLRGATTGDALQRSRASGRASASVDWAAYVHFGDPLDRPLASS
ncbi:MAG TPA: CHAT domain-containing protein [Planctomycetota bacterium]|nr:CHAT domain-containing protein [Planctomycetota bacterium]